MALTKQDAKSEAFPMLYTSGSYYQVGFNIGTFFKHQIRCFFETSQRVQKMLLPFLATPQGRKYYNEVLEASKEDFPQIVREMQGMADGCGLKFEDIFLLNIRKEIQNVLIHDKATRHLALPVDGSEGCTVVMVNTPEVKLLAHNEDGDPLMDDKTYMISARIYEDGKEVESFTSFCYAGHVPGSTFAFNGHGMAFTVNETFPNYFVRKAPAQFIMNRAAIRARNIDEALDIMRNRGRGSAYGFNTNIADIRFPHRMWAVELIPVEGESRIHVYDVDEQTQPDKPCHFFHVNHYNHEPFRQNAVAELVKSSDTRTATLDQFQAPRTLGQTLSILGDASHESYPIYRSPRPTDDSITIVTGVFDLLDGRLDVYRGNPAEEGVRPLMRFPMTKGETE